MKIARQMTMLGQLIPAAKDIAVVFGCRTTTVYNWVRKIGCPAIITRKGARNLYLFDPEEVKRWLKESYMAGTLNCIDAYLDADKLDDAPSLVYKKIKHERTMPDGD